SCNPCLAPRMSARATAGLDGRLHWTAAGLPERVRDTGRRIGLASTRRLSGDCGITGHRALRATLTPMPVFERLSLRVNGANAVGDVTDAWNRLVGGHRLAALTATAVGEPLHHAVENGDAYALYETLLERARSRYRVAVDVRAVSPAEVTRCELSLVPRGFDGEVELSLR